MPKNICIQYTNNSLSFITVAHIEKTALQVRTVIAKKVRGDFTLETISLSISSPFNEQRYLTSQCDVKYSGLHLLCKPRLRIKPLTFFKTRVVFDINLYFQKCQGSNSAKQLTFACRTSGTPAVPIKPGARSVSCGFI